MISSRITQVAMNCREFRKQHFAYLDDTMPGDEMSAAQRHIMSCDGCAAHDTMVRRSLMLVRNMATIEPSLEFRQRMQARLNETRALTKQEKALRVEALPAAHFSFATRQPFVVTAIAATVLVAVAVVWRHDAALPEALISLQPVTVSTPALADTTQAEIYLAPGIVQAMSTGNPMWPAALMVNEASSRFSNAGFSQVSATR